MAPLVCRSCHALLFEGTAFCGQCHTPVARTPEETSALLKEVHAASGLWRAPRVPAPGWKPDDRHLRPPPLRVKSRWRPSALTFGPAGRVGITVAIVAVVGWLILFGPSPASGLIFAAPGGWAIRDVWRAAVVPVPPPARAEDADPRS